MCVGRDGHTLFAADFYNNVVRRIEMSSKGTTNVYTCEDGYYIVDIVCVREMAGAAQAFAALFESKEKPHTYEVSVLEESGDHARLAVTQRCALDETTEGVCLGRLLELCSGELVARAYAMMNVHVWRRGDQTARKLHIPCEHYQTYGMCVMENVLGKQEIIALAFYDGKSIGMFAIEQNNLVSIKFIQLEFLPYRLWWIASKQTLLVSKDGGNTGEMCALRVTESDMTSQIATLDGVDHINVSSWCVLRDETGGGCEHALALFDYNTMSVMKFEFE